jgi:hypothetical protein
MSFRHTSFFILFAAVLCAGPAAAAGSRFDSFFAPGNSAEYGLQVEPAHDGSPRVLHQKARGSLVLAKTEAQSWTLQGGASHFDLSQKVVLPQTGVVFPDSLGSVEGGISYLRRLGDRRQWGANFSVGSASDHLFNSIHETEFQLTGSYMIPARRQNAWLFLLQYSNNRTFLNNVPLPGFAYLWNLPERGFQLIAGFPFLSLNYRPTPAWSMGLNLLGTNQSAEIARRVAGPVWAYAAYQNAPEQWMRRGRNDNANRLIYDEKKAGLGLRSELGKRFSLDLFGGRTFDRRLFESRNATHTGAPRVNLRNGWLTGLTLSARWGE